MSDASVRGRFVWHELMTSDTTSAAAFYTKVVGWKTRAWDQDASYIMFLGEGRPMAGLMVLPEDAKAMGVPPNWGTYVGTPDVDATAKQAVSLGGKVLKPPTEIPTIGRFAVLQDPQGAAFLVITPLPPSPPSSQSDSELALGDFSWHELATTDWRAALTFYQQLFGWEEMTGMDMGPEMGTYQMFGWKGKMLGGMFNKPPQMPGPPSWLPYVKARDSKAVAAAVKKLGGQVIHGPSEVPGGDWIVQAIDLQGAVFAVHSTKPAAKEPVAAKAVKTAATKTTRAAKTANAAVKKVKTLVKKVKAAIKPKPAVKKAKAAPKKAKAVARKAKPVARKAAKAAARPRTSSKATKTKATRKAAGAKRPAAKKTASKSSKKTSGAPKKNKIGRRR